MFRTLRAFAWMRWRVLANSLERMGGRDRLERLSIAVEQILPLIAYALLVPSAIGLAGLGGYAGYWLAGGSPVMTFEALRILLLAACGFAVVGPLLMPSMEPTAIVRLLLLPIPRGTLYAAQAAGGLGEPWVLIALPVVLSIPVGLAAAGAWMGAAISFVAGVLLILCLIGLSALSTLLLHLVVRDRRRGELLALLFIVVLPALSLMPALLMTGRDGPAGDGAAQNHHADARVDRADERGGVRGRPVRALRARDTIRGAPRRGRSTLSLVRAPDVRHGAARTRHVDVRAAAGLSVGRNAAGTVQPGSTRQDPAALSVEAERRRRSGAAAPGAADSSRTIDAAGAARRLRRWSGSSRSAEARWRSGSSTSPMA